MRCNHAVPHLKAYLDGETSGWHKARIRRHLRSCPACAAQLAEWQKLNTLLLSNDLVFDNPAFNTVVNNDFAANNSVPGKLVSNAFVPNDCVSHSTVSMSAVIPVAAEPRRRKGQPAMSFKLLTGCVATSAAVLALLLLPNKTRHNMSMAAEIRQAVSNVNTWHLKGWKLQNGKPLAWEVWGRRTPFFYREQVGQDVIVDDGRSRVSLFAPLKRNGRPDASGIALKTPSMPDASNTRWSYTQMVAQWDNISLRPDAQTAEDATFDFAASGVFLGGGDDTMADLLYTVNRQTWLPTHYEARLGKPNAKHTLAALNADYNAPVPADVTQLPSIPPTYKVYDAAQSAPTGENTVTRNGITVQTIPLLLTSDGLILLRVKTWLGGALIDRYGPLLIGASADRWVETGAMITPANRDNAKRGYTQVQWEAIQAGNHDHTSALLLLAPADPLPPDAPPATELTLQLDVAAQMDTRLSGTMGMSDQQLARQTMTLAVALPAPSAPAAQSLTAYIDPDWKQRTLSFEGYENLPAAVDMARSVFYGDLVDLRNPDRPHMGKSVAYSEKFFVETSCPGIAALYHYLTAQKYVAMGNKTRARQLLQETLDDKRLDAQLQPANNPMLAALPAPTRKQMQEEGRQNLKSKRQSAQEALNTWAK